MAPKDLLAAKTEQLSETPSTNKTPTAQAFDGETASPRFSPPSSPARSVTSMFANSLYRRPQAYSSAPAIAGSSSTALRSSWFRRIVQVLDLDPDSSEAARKAPRPPTFWSDHTHRQALLEKWDVESEKDNDHDPVMAPLARVEAAILGDYGELGAGEVVLSREWISYVLAMGRRFPFRNDEVLMGRWEALALGGGSRGVWGAW